MWKIFYDVFNGRGVPDVVNELWLHALDIHASHRMKWLSVLLWLTPCMHLLLAGASCMVCSSLVCYEEKVGEIISPIRNACFPSPTGSKMEDGH